MNKRKTILIYALTITVLAVSIIGFTYAWFSTEIDSDVGNVVLVDNNLIILYNEPKAIDGTVKVVDI